MAHLQNVGEIGAFGKKRTMVLLFCICLLTIFFILKGDVLLICRNSESFVLRYGVLFAVQVMQKNKKGKCVVLSSFVLKTPFAQNFLKKEH